MINHKKHNKVFGKVLRRLRKDRGHTQETLAFEAELDRTYVSLLELGQRSPTLDTIMALGHALGVSLSEFALKIEADLRSERASHD